MEGKRKMGATSPITDPDPQNGSSHHEIHNDVVFFLVGCMSCTTYILYDFHMQDM